MWSWWIIQNELWIICKISSLSSNHGKRIKRKTLLPTVEFAETKHARNTADLICSSILISRIRDYQPIILKTTQINDHGLITLDTEFDIQSRATKNILVEFLEHCRKESGNPQLVSMLFCISTFLWLLNLLVIVHGTRVSTGNTKLLHFSFSIRLLTLLATITRSIHNFTSHKLKTYICNGFLQVSGQQV